MKPNIETHTTGPATLAGRIPRGGENILQPAPLADAEFCRLPNPRRGRCPISGLSRSALIDLGVTVPGLLVRLRKPGAVRGAVLMHLPTLRQYLRDMREAQIKKEGEA